MTDATTTDNLNLDQIQARADAATSGPWMFDGTTLWGCDEHGPLRVGDTIANDADREFIAHARADVPALVAEVRWLRDLANQLADDAAAADQTTWALRHAVTNALGVDYDTRVDSIASRITDLVADTTEENQ
jgi:cbb3-type cytochrome oxidase cytochrome c subunit